MSEAASHPQSGDHEHSGESHQHFSVLKIFITLFVLTGVEVAWGLIIPYEKKALLWSGLMICAIWKAGLIFNYFMHMKYEGIIVKGNILFTIPLVIYMMTMLLPDTAYNDRMNYRIGDQLDPETGEVMMIGTGSRNKTHHKDHAPKATDFGPADEGDTDSGESSGD